MLALINLSTIPGVDVPDGRESVATITPNAGAAWRRFVDALMRALAAWPV